MAVGLADIFIEPGLAAALIAAGTVSALGDALSTVQTTTEVVNNPLTGAAGTATNVTGNKAAYVAGEAIMGAADRMAQYHLSMAEKLVPAIAVGSGEKVWVVLLEGVQLPHVEGP